MQSTPFVTGYTNPDLDATACAVAYAEYLTQSGQEAVAALFGTPHREAQFVLTYFQIAQPLNAEKVIDESTEVILVDASDTRGISEKINPTQVIELIDHRKVHEAELFPRAKVQIELVGSAATLIAEKFASSNFEISPGSAALLYSAIISNTVHFQASVTTERDKNMAAWLATKVTIPDGYIKQMFTAKSQFHKPLKQVIKDDFATFCFGSCSLGVAQLEIVEVGQLLATRREEIDEVLTHIQAEQGLDHIFLTAIDLEKATNTFVVVDAGTQELLERSLQVVFHDRAAQRPGILMRKTIVPLIKDSL